MLNTKPIKKNQSDALSSDIYGDYKKNQDIDGVNKVIKLEPSKQKELENIVKSANSEFSDKNDKNDNNLKQSGGANNGVGGELNESNKNSHGNINYSGSKAYQEFTNDSYKDGNLNVTGIIGGSRLVENNQIDRQDVVNIFRLNQYNDNPVNNQIKTNTYANWNLESNCFVIMENGSEYKISNDDILKSVLSQEHSNHTIKKYLFITTWNQNVENFEFNFVDSIITNDLELVVRVQNFLYDTLINFDSLDITDTYNYRDIILMFYYQFVIFMFNKQSVYSKSNDPNKIARVYSSLVYRFSSLVLKNILEVKNNIDTNNDILNKLLSIRTDIFTQINFINEKIDWDNSNSNSNSDSKFNQSTHKSTDVSDTQTNTSNSNYKYESESESESKSTQSTNSNNLNSSKSSNSSKSYHIVNSRKLKKTSEDETYPNTLSRSEKPIENFKIMGKNGNPIRKLKDMFSDDIKINTEITDNNDSELSDNYDSDKNGYYEIDDNVSDYLKFKNKLNFNKTNIKKLNPIENSFTNTNTNTNTNTKSVTTNNTDNKTQTLSYDPNSALKNSKIFKVNF